MTGAQAVAALVGIGGAGVIFELVRRRQIRDKYAGLWLLLAIGMTFVAFVPGVLARIASVLSFVEPASALFFVALLILLLMVGHLSWEVSRLENETRRLSEELALLRLEAESREDLDGGETNEGRLVDEVD